MAKKLTKPTKRKTSKEIILPDAQQGEVGQNDSSVLLTLPDAKHQEGIPTNADAALPGGKQDGQAATVVEPLAGEQVSGVPLLHDFWKAFRLSPIPFEHTVITNIRWLALILLGPPILLVTLSIISLSISQKFDLQEAFSDLGDEIFISASLSLFFSAVLFCYRWYPTLPETFDSMLENEVLRTREGKRVTNAEFLGFLEDYRRNLHSTKRYVLPAISILVCGGAALWISNSRGLWNLNEIEEPLRAVYLLHISTRWVLAPVLWSLIASLWFWAILSTARSIRDISKRFRIYIQPLHSDRAGGWKRVGDLSSSVGLIIIVAVTAGMVIAIPGTIQSLRLVSCGSEFQQSLDLQSDGRLATDQLTDCMYGLLQEEGVSREGIARFTRSLSIRHFFDASGLLRDYNQSIFRIYSIIYAIDLVILIGLILAIYAIFWPLFDIHTRMAEYKYRREREINHQIGALSDELSVLIQQNAFDRAYAIKAKIDFLTTELATIQKYPTWPIRPLPAVRSYLATSLLTALVSYAGTQLAAIIIQAIKTRFGN